MFERIDRFISVVGGGLIEPIIALFEKLESIVVKDRKMEYTEGKENGYSASIILLSAVILESAVIRLMYDDGREDFKNSRKYFEGYIIENGLNSTLYDDFREIMAVRDSITHNHLWEEKKDTNNISKKLLNGFGDSNYKAVVDEKTAKTKKNRINLVPTDIKMRDAGIVFVKTYEILRKIEEKQTERRVPCIMVSWEQVKFMGKRIHLSDFINQLKILFFDVLKR
jgi:hypothetical protein